MWCSIDTTILNVDFSGTIICYFHYMTPVLSSLLLWFKRLSTFVVAELKLSLEISGGKNDE